MSNIPGYISPENREEVDKLIKPRREAKTRGERNKAREEINNKVLDSSKTAWTHITEEE